MSLIPRDAEVFLKCLNMTWLLYYGPPINRALMESDVQRGDLQQGEVTSIVFFTAARAPLP